MEFDERIRRRKLSDEVFDRLKQAIVQGDLATGDVLPSERDLMERYGVGRPAVREAMQALSSLGLINISHGERARITTLTPESLFRQIDLPAKLMLSASEQSLRHLLEARLFLDRGMVSAAAAKASAEEIVALRTNIEKQTAALSDIDRFIAHDMEFHVSIARIVGNPIYVAISQAMLGWLREYHTERLHWSGRENVTLAEHAEIVDRIAAHDPGGAEAAMAKHLDRSSSVYKHPNGRDAGSKPAPGRPRKKRGEP